MPRKQRPFIRESAVRDARLVVIASEDSEATPTYFETLDAHRYIPHIEEAIERAVALDVNPTDRWPQQLGTHVYRLARSIIDSAPYGRKK